MRIYKKKYSDEFIEKTKEKIKFFRLWTEEEIQLLKNEYLKYGIGEKEKLVILFHKKGYTDRTLQGITKQASNLKITNIQHERKIKNIFICKKCGKKTNSYCEHKREYCTDCKRLITAKKYRQTINGKISHLLHVKNDYEKNKEKINKAKKIHYQKNKERLNAISKKYREENKEKVKEYQKRYREENKERKREMNKLYYQKDKERRIKYQKRYRENKKLKKIKKT